MDRVFNVGDMAKVLGTKQRRVESWVERKLIAPQRRGEGSGRRHVFGLAQILTGAILLELQLVFGDKSRFLSRVLPLAQQLIPEWLEATRGEPFDSFLLVKFSRGLQRHAPAQFVEVRLIDGRGALKPELAKGLSLVVLDVTAAFREVTNRLNLSDDLKN